MKQSEVIRSAYLFDTGQSFESYNFLGLHKDNGSYIFRVWAPNAREVSLAGTFNNWDLTATRLQKIQDTGIWQGEIPHLKVGDLYKVAITGPNGQTQLKIDPYARQFEKKPGVAAVVTEPLVPFHDQEYLEKRAQENNFKKPLNIYEVNLESWRKNGDRYYDYHQLAVELIPYALQMGYTHLELMPITEYLLDASWGYQAFGYFAPTSRNGTPNDFRRFIDQAHQAGLGVIMDWVPGHFIKNYDVLYQYDGTPTFEASSAEVADNRRWGTLNFDYAKSQVQSYLISSALFWIQEMHLDGLRIDAVSAMIYLNYDLGKEDWKNSDGTVINYDGVKLIQMINQQVQARHPEVLMIAEESTDFAGVTLPPSKNGLGFKFKWNMGWMHDTLKFFELDPLFRKDHFKLLTFSFIYMFNENFILPFSHDEVVHGKKSLMHKMFGDRDHQFANLRMMYVYLMSHPGKKLLFMGSEWGQFLEWREASALEWADLDDNLNRKMQVFTQTLNHIYLNNKALWQNDHHPGGIQLTQVDDPNLEAMAFIRRGDSDQDVVAAAFNFIPVEKKHFQIAVPFPGKYELLINTEDQRFGGTWSKMQTSFNTINHPLKSEQQYLEVTLPANGALLIKRTRGGTKNA